MIPENIIDILLDHQDTITDEIDIINKSIIRISDALKSASSIILEKLTDEANGNDMDEESEAKYLKQSQAIRKYVKSLQEIELHYGTYGQNEESITTPLDNSKLVYVVANNTCPVCKTKLSDNIIHYTNNNNKTQDLCIKGCICPSCHRQFLLDKSNYNFADTNIKLSTEYYNRLSLYDVIVLKNINSCSKNNHQLEDVEAVIMVINSSGLIEQHKYLVSYCRTCNQYIMLESEYKKIIGIPVCQIIDERTDGKSPSTKRPKIVYSNTTGSKLQNSGYNVNCIDNLTEEQRHTILGLQLTTHSLTSNEIISYIDTYIESGQKRSGSVKCWDRAVRKWESDKQFVQNFNAEEFDKQIGVSKLILRYTRNKNPE